MKRLGVGVLVTAMALLWVGLARAERETAYRSPGFGGEPKPKPVPDRGVMFAAGSAAGAKRMAPELRDERKFLKDAAASSRFESEASKLALAKSNNAAVRAFATTLINHHATTSTELYHLLHGRGMAPPMFENDQRKKLNRLAKLQGPKFDREYLDVLGPKYLQEDVQFYERAAAVTQDAALKTWITRMSAATRQHLAMAERIGSATENKVTRAEGSRTGSSSGPGRGAVAPRSTKDRARPQTVSTKPTGSNNR